MEADFFKKVVSQNLKQIRESKGLSTSALAQILGVSQAKISYIEHCKGVLSAADVALLARRLNVPVTEFFRGLDSGDEAGVRELVHHLIRFGAVLLAKPKGLVIEGLPFEETFCRALGFLDDTRLHQGFLAALITQAGVAEIYADRIFARIGDSPFLVNKAIEETGLALRISEELATTTAFPWSRVKQQLQKIIAAADGVIRAAGWNEAHQPLTRENDQLPELVRFVSECLSAEK